MKTLTKAFVTGCFVLATTGAALAQDNPIVGCAAMFADQNIVENAVPPADHITLVGAVQAAGLAALLQSEGPFTVFAPTKATFTALPAGTVETLLQTANKETLIKTLTCHVVGAKAMAADVRKMVTDDGVIHVIDKDMLPAG